MSEALPDMVDLAFALRGRELPRTHRAALAAALEAVLPWLADEPDAAVHRLNVAAGGGPVALLSGRTKLTLRLPRRRLDDAARLAGRTLDVAGTRLEIGAAQERELLAFGTQYAHVVAAEGSGNGAAEGGFSEDEAGFLQQVQQGLERIGVKGRVICGRLQRIESEAIAGHGLMVDGLSRAGALALLAHGLGPHRRLGCGVFVPHKSAAAVGMPE